MSEQLHRTILFDCSPLSSFARANRLEVLEDLTSYADTRPTTRFVLEVEVRRGMSAHSSLEDIYRLPWLDVVDRTDVAHSQEDWGAIQWWRERIGVEENEKNLGECTVLAYAERLGALAIIDDKDARDAVFDAAPIRGVRVTGTLGLVDRGVEGGLLSSLGAAELVQRLRSVGGARFHERDLAAFDWWKQNPLEAGTDSAT